MANPLGTKRFEDPQPAGLWLLGGLVLFALVLLLAHSRLQPPAPRPQDAPLAEFSGGRARQVHQMLVGDGRPHPTGSEGNALVRDRVLGELRRLGYQPQVQSDVVCLPFGCARVENILARLPGREAGRAVLLMAHYDSVGAGPGASDDMAGVAAVLETARALKAGPAPRSPVLILIDDGEEAGLFGARAFAERPEAKEVGVVVNLEARGASGASVMFETAGPDAWMIDRYAGGARHPITSSVFSTIYDALPNDTDLTVFKERGFQGLNFAYIADPTHYHTSVDDIQSASPASLQHHGDNALAAVRALAEANLAKPPAGKAVFFDVLGWGVVRWPAALSLVLAIAALVLVILAAVLVLRRGARVGGPGWGGVGFGLLGFLGMVVAAGLVAFGLARGLFAGLLLAPWVAHPVPLLTVFWLLPAAIVLAVAGTLWRRGGMAGTWAGVWIVWAIAGIALAVLAPGLSYLFLVPALAAGLAGLLAAFLPGRPGSFSVLAVLIPGVVMAVLWMPLVLFLYDGLGAGALMPIAVLVALGATTLAPLAAGSGPGVRRWVPLGLAAVALVCVFMAVTRPQFSETSPQGVNLQLAHSADTGQSKWLIVAPPPIPRPLLQTAKFEEPATPFPWSPPYYRVPAAPAPALAAAAPEVALLEDSPLNGKRRVRLRVTSPRGARTVTLVIPKAAGVEALRAGGVEVPMKLTGREARFTNPRAEWLNFSYLTLPPEGVEIEAVLASTGKHDWYVIDQTPGLPATGAALLKARPSAAVPYQDGDLTTVSRKVGI
ncbi:MAG TPA: M20/M25/M40 family metallo-hydrolase [Thermoanaerobaculia bacterium]|nr:M20/M25/M40 family metallo-hydrolase [Thermoanaerobaculia bacterium]